MQKSAVGSGVAQRQGAEGSQRKRSFGGNRTIPSLQLSPAAPLGTLRAMTRRDAALAAGLRWLPE